MPVLKNSASSRRSSQPEPRRGRSRSGKAGTGARGPGETPSGSWRALLGIFLLLSGISGAAAYWCASRGYTLYYGDAEAHLNISRRLLDSRTPGPEQIGTVWLPLPHVLTALFVHNDSWWRCGVAGVIP